VRLDKWLWAARFFKTRSLAKQAIDNGRVRYNGERCKVSREVAVGAQLSVRQGWDDIDVEVLALSDQRCAAPLARLLYRETEQSRLQREKSAAERRAVHMPASDERPSKKDRRHLIRFKRSLSD
jgi:ribosome-associated heat shock protein Hsp15